MYFTKITRHLNCDILINRNDIEIYGFDKNKTEGEMIDLAIKYDCPVIIKNGKNGKWYLKGKGMTNEFLNKKIQENKDKCRDGVFCLILE